MGLHLEILGQERKEIFEKLKAFKDSGCLAGGTALALQLGHRVSVDFDIFCERPIKKNLILEAKKIFKIKDILINNQDELTFLTDKGIKISFIYYPFNLKKYYLENCLPMKILSAQGIALTKAYTLNRRNSWRDYLDLYSILKNDLITLKEIIVQSKDVYDEAFSEKLFLAQLIYTDDIVQTEIKGTKILGKKISLEEIEHFFQKQIDDYL
ncbi:nucleotidyl transferase AbiEii/AbiGii toxin family protein [Patescibacteria group bacterium]|nr:nucleotidyl transferase AbiEii/AbiGii toxin family protein [Patescibacteria group bacterium]